MNARNLNGDEFAIDVILQKISQFSAENPKSKRVKISITLDYDTDRFEQYEESLNLLKKKGVIEALETSGKAETIEDQFTGRHEMYLYIPSFRINKKRMGEFLVSTSRIPKYTLKMDADRRLILNDVYLLVTPQFDSPNRHFIEYCLSHSDSIVTKEEVEKRGGKEIQRFHAVLHNLKIAPYLDAIFFPNISAAAVEFRNNVTTEQLGSKINENRVKRFIKTLNKVKPQKPLETFSNLV